MAAYRRVYDSRHLQADCQEPGSASGPYARQSSTGYTFLVCRCIRRLRSLYITRACAVGGVSAGLKIDFNVNVNEKRDGKSSKTVYDIICA